MLIQRKQRYRVTKHRFVLTSLCLLAASLIVSCASNLNNGSFSLGRATAAANDHARPRVSVVLRTWKKDVGLALFGLSTIYEHMESDLLEVVVVTDQDSETEVRSALEPFLKNATQSPIRIYVEENFLFNGHIQQKFSKMMADTYTSGDYIFHLDSDCAMVQWRDECYLKEGKPVNDFDTFERIQKSEPNPETGVISWQNGTQRLLGIDFEPYEFSRLNQHVYPREVYPILRKQIEKVHGVSFRDAFKELRLVGTRGDWKKDPNTTLISDFNLLGAASFHFAPELMYQKNLSDPKESWRPFCIVQCNIRTRGAEACHAWLQEQSRVAKSGGTPELHFKAK